MRYVTLLGLAFLLSGCGYQTWWNLPFSSGSNPNLPTADSENIQRVEGDQPEIAPLTPEAGDIWPGPIKPPPTLEDLEKAGNLAPSPELPVPGSPLNRDGLPPEPSPNPSSGSSTLPGNAQPGLSPLPATPGPPGARQVPPATAYRGQTGHVIQTPQGPNVTTGGTPGYQTTTSPGGGQSIIVPNGNGTSTVIHSDGRVETIPNPH